MLGKKRLVLMEAPKRGSLGGPEDTWGGQGHSLTLDTRLGKNPRGTRNAALTPGAAPCPAPLAAPARAPATRALRANHRVRRSAGLRDAQGALPSHWLEAPRVHGRAVRAAPRRGRARRDVGPQRRPARAGRRHRRRRRRRRGHLRGGRCVGESGAAISEGIPWRRMAWPGPQGSGGQSASVSRCSQVCPGTPRCSVGTSARRQRCTRSTATRLQDLIPTQPWGTELLRVTLGWILFFVKKLFYASAGV